MVREIDRQRRAVAAVRSVVSRAASQRRSGWPVRADIRSVQAVTIGRPPVGM